MQVVVRHGGPLDVRRHGQRALSQRELAPELEQAAGKAQEEVSQGYAEADRALALLRQEGEAEEMAAE
jgi:hypothetical protein